MAIVPAIFFTVFINQKGSLIQSGTYFNLFIISLLIYGCTSKYIWKYYFILFKISVIVFILQEITWYTTGLRFTALIPGLEFSFYDEIDSSEMSQFQQNFNRSCSLFLEPAVFAKFLIPAFIYAVTQRRKKILFIIFIIVILFLLRSGIGFILLFTCTIYLILNIQISNKITKGIIILVISSIVVGGVSMLSLTPYGQEVFSRLEEVDPSDQTESSGFYRVFRGYLLYEGMSEIEKVCGVGTKNIGLVIEKSPYRLFFKDNKDVYLNGIQAILVGGGIIGLCLFCLMLYNLRSGNQTTNMLLLCIFVVSFAAAEYLSPTMVFYLCAAITMRNNEKEDRELCNICG